MFENHGIRDSLKEEMEVQIVWQYNDRSITIAQLEYANIDKFLQEQEDEIRKILTDVKREKNLYYILINCVDILNGYSTILVVDNETEKLISDLLQVKFENQKAKLDELILRKEIFRMLNAKIEK